MRSAILLMAVLLSIPALAVETAGQEEETSGDDAPLQVEEGRAEGEWIRVEYRNESGRIDRFAVGGSLYFSAIDMPGPFQAEADGARLVFKGDGFQVEVFDDPRGVAHFRSEGQGFSFNPAWAVTSRQAEGHVQLTYDQTTAVLMGAEKDGHRLNLSNGTFFRTGPQAGVLAMDEDPVDPVLDQLDGLAAQGKVIGWGRLGEHDLRFLPLVEGSHETKTDSALKARLYYRSAPEDAHLMVIEIEAGRMDPEEMHLRFYEDILGFKVATDMPRVDDVQELLSQENETITAYHVQEGLEGIRVIVSFAPEDDHGLEIRGSRPFVPPVVTFGLLAGLLTVVGGTGFFFLDKWRPRRF